MSYWRDINDPGFFSPKNNAAPLGAPEDIKFDTSPSKPEAEEVKFTKGTWVKPAAGYRFLEKCFVEVEATFLKITSNRKIEISLFVVYNNQEEDLKHKVETWLDDSGKARAEVKLYYGEKYYDARSTDPSVICQYFFKVSHSTVKNQFRSSPLEMPPDDAVPKMEIAGGGAVVYVKQAWQSSAHRIAVKLSLTGAVIAEAVFDSTRAAALGVYETETGGAEVSLPYSIPANDLKAGKTVFVEGKQAGLGVELNLQLMQNGAKFKDPAKVTIDSLKLTLSICKNRTDPATAPDAFSDQQKLDPGRYIHEQDGNNGHERCCAIVRAVEPADFKGKLLLFAADAQSGDLVDRLAVFTDAQETAAAGQTPQANPLEIDYTGTEIRFWIEGKKVSSAPRDCSLKLGAPNVKNSAGKLAGGDEVLFTVIKTNLVVHKSRIAAGTDPAAFTGADAINIGRYLHIQDPGYHHGRAKILIKQIIPAAVEGTLTLRCWDATAKSVNDPRIDLYEAEIAASGQAGQANPLDIVHDATFPAAGKIVWAQGKKISSTLRDSELQMGIKDHIGSCNRVAFTVVRFKNIRADIPPSPARTVRLANGPARHLLQMANGALQSADFDLDVTVNEPLTLIEGCIPAANPVNLTVDIEPAAANAAVSWDVKRDRRPGQGDDAKIVALAGNKEAPTITPDAADKLKATLQADAVGSFHVCPYIDCNGSRTFDFDDASGTRIDREPHLIMNYLIVRAQGKTNTSVAQQANVNITPAVPTSASGVSVSTGNFASGAGAGTHCKSVVEVTGGGPDGKRGIDYVFAGWVNNEVLENNRMTYREPALPNTIHQRFTVWHNHGGASLFPTIANPAAPIVALPGPFLDTTDFGNEGTGGDTACGTEGAVGPPTAIVKANNPIGVGELWTVEMWDSPGDSCPAQHENSATAVLQSYRFDLDFRVDLCFWTNKGKVPGTIPDEAANRLYASVQTNTWTIRLMINFNVATGIATIVTPLAIALTRDGNPTRRAIPVEGAGLEVRFPITLKMLVVDART